MVDGVIRGEVRSAFELEALFVDVATVCLRPVLRESKQGPLRVSQAEPAPLAVSKATGMARLTHTCGEKRSSTEFNY
jgi:hypothetical protein